MPTKIWFALTIGLGWALGGCDDGGPDALGTAVGTDAGTDAPSITIPPLAYAQQALAELEHFPDCDSLLDAQKAKAAVEIESLAQANLELMVSALNAGTSGCYVFYPTAGTIAAVEGGGASPATSTPSASTYSTTNVQVPGVDEADFIKNDGSYLYVVGNGQLEMIAAWPPEEARIVATLPLAGDPQRLYVTSDRALVFSSLDPLEPAPDSATWSSALYGYAPERDCTYGYSCEFSGDGHALALTVIDITDRTVPTVLRQLELDGSYLNSRRVDDIVHTVVTFQARLLPGLQVVPTSVADYREQCLTTSSLAFPYSEFELRQMFAQLEVDNLAVIANATLADFVPRVRDSRMVGGETVVVDRLLDGCDRYYLSQTDESNRRLSLLSLDLGSQETLGSTTVVGKPGAVYASREALYVAARHYRGASQDWYFGGSEIDEATTIDKFALTAGSVETRYVGSGVTQGRVLNQFALDEYAGTLRVATTTGHIPDPAAHSTVTVFVEHGARLEPVAQVDGIAPGEDLRAVRFFGDVGYVVTFKKTDPLFVLDFADPRRPALRGELKIPGFSTYLHRMDDGHLLTMGYDADDLGSFAWFAGLQLQVVEVSDLGHPSLLFRELIGTRGSTSDAATDHLAFNYFPDLELLAVPMTICEGGTAGSYGTEMTFNGLLVYRVTVAGGFVPLGGVSHGTGTGTPAVTCTNWWTESNSTVKRSVFMDNYVFSVARDQILVARLDDLAHPLGSIPLVAAP